MFKVSKRSQWQTLVIVGCQWGDEGKGKFTDYLAPEADYIVRFQGGNNAGHTVVHQGKTYKFNLLPSGVLYPGKTLVLGSGMIIDPKVLLWEINQLTKQGIKLKVLISNKAHVILPHHILVDSYFDEIKGKFAAGSTKRGIAPCYSDKYLRCGIRMIDFIQPKIFKQKLDLSYKVKQATLAPKLYRLLPKKNLVYREYLAYAKKIKSLVGETELVLNQAIERKKKVIFETAMAMMLDIDHGVYPHTTSSNTIAGAVCATCGLPPKKINRVLGVFKAYLSRVGVSPLPTELLNQEGDDIRKVGAEYGTTTGRPRRIGWLDLTSLRLAKILNGLDALAVTKLDVLGGLPKIKICTHYLYRGKKLLLPPAQSEQFAQCQPVYKSFLGWPKLTTEQWVQIAKHGYQALPLEVKHYLNFIQKEIGVPIELISVGADRQATIKR